MTSRVRVTRLGTMTSEVRRRRLSAVAFFGVIVALDLLYVWLARGVHHQPPLADDASLDVAEVFGALAQAAVGLAVTWVRPRNPIGWIISCQPFFLTLCDVGQTYGARAAVFPGEHLPLSHLVLALSAPLWIPALFIPATVLLVRYPTGRIGTRWGRRFDRCVLVGLPLLWITYATSKEAVSDVVRGGTGVVPAPPQFVLLPLSLVIVGLCLTGLVGILGEAVYRAVTTAGPERMALLWLLSFVVVGVAAVWFGPSQWLGTLLYNAIMVGVAVGVLRYGAAGIEVVVRRALVYAVLTGLVLAVFGIVVAALARIVPSGSAPQLVAAAVVAVGLAPARDRVQGAVDRVMYGERHDPIAALRRLGTPVGSAATGLVPEVLAGLATALRVEKVTIEPDGGVPLTVAGEQLGTLVVAPRRGEAALGPADTRLIEALAPMIATVVHADRLTEDLIRERGRVVAAATGERNRLRQELHDGLGPSLTGIGLGLDAAATRHDPVLIARLRAEVGSALEEVRRIIDDLRPTALDDADLVTALRRRADQLRAHSAIDVTVDVPGAAVDVPEQVATAAYRIADEALTNVVRHSGASSCQVRVEIGRDLSLEVVDDGVGPASERVGGVGLHSMRERAERSGGTFDIRPARPGTRVRARIPLEDR